LCPNINHNIANITIIKNRKHGGSISHLREVIRKSKLCIYLIFTIFKILNPSTISISNILHINKIDNQKYKKIINKFVDINNITKNPTLIFFFQNYHFIELYSNKNNLEFIYKLIDLTCICDKNLKNGNKDCLHLEHYIISIIDLIHNIDIL